MSLEQAKLIAAVFLQLLLPLSVRAHCSYLMPQQELCMAQQYNMIKWGGGQ